MKYMTIGQLSKQTDVGIGAIRFYEKEQLIDKPPRTTSGYRQYTDDTISRLNFIRSAKALGFQLKEIKDLLSLRYYQLDPETT